MLKNIVVELWLQDKTQLLVHKNFWFVFSLVMFFCLKLHSNRYFQSNVYIYI